MSDRIADALQDIAERSDALPAITSSQTKVKSMLVETRSALESALHDMHVHRDLLDKYPLHVKTLQSLKSDLHDTFRRLKALRSKLPASEDETSSVKHENSSRSMSK
jgi:hypothetical protein